MKDRLSANKRPWLEVPCAEQAEPSSNHGNRYREDRVKKLRNRMQGIFAGILLAAVLAAAFMAYLRPSFVVDLANRLILCT
jgi:hypothetical protein